MARNAVRELKRTMRRATPARGRIEAQEAAVHLLERSICFGHGKLAVLRLLDAARLGASLRPECWAYCTKVAAKSPDPALEWVLLEARALSDS